MRTVLLGEVRARVPLLGKHAVIYHSRKTLMSAEPA